MAEQESTNGDLKKGKAGYYFLGKGKLMLEGRQKQIETNPQP